MRHPAPSRTRIAALIAAALLCAAASPALAIDVETLIATGGRVSGDELARRIAAAGAFPLGSKDNPIRVALPSGQHAYLSHLRCSNGARPRFGRVGSFGPGPYDSIIDGYRVACPGISEDAMLFMDMYHPEHRETAAPPGFTLVR
ncbi:hypothetical protein [uncultured Methylobacterium sp.]|jgi:hypothetical protein|uniref:hypothetical protein n=1 Tax=uncultured Methylobacterium sp. TaxID=157278 RepID=UPI002630C702|nr:hypothetical protein [uncultured Methylobacterium sp.]